MEFLFALAGSILAGFIAAWLMQLRFKGTVFGRVTKHVGFGVFFLGIAFSLYMIFGLNIWSACIIPVISLIVILIIVKNAIGRLLEI